MLKRLSQIGFLLCLATVVGWPQKDKKDYPPPTPKPAPTAKPDRSVKVYVPDPPRAPRYPRYEGVTSEKAIAADPNVAVQLCVSDGDVKVNGSERNEVRVFVRNGRKFEFRLLEEAGSKVSWVELIRTTGNAPIAGRFANCLGGESIEIDMPVRGKLMMTGRSAMVTVDSILNASINLVEGDINVRNISGGLNAETDQGKIVAESVEGEVRLDTTSGNIVAFDLKSKSPRDPLKASTLKGTISLQNVTHRQLDVSAVSGHVKYVGGFTGGGIYKFRSGSGRIGLLLPVDVDCKLSANYGFGSFNSSFTMKILTETTTDGGKSIVGQLGAGKGPVINLETTSGSISIVKQGEIDLP